MDIISHVLWTNLVFKEVPVAQRSLVVVFGILPDLISFSFIALKHFVRRTMHYTNPPLSALPKYVFKLYNITHSLVIWLAVFLFLKILDIDMAFRLIEIESIENGYSLFQNVKR